MGDETQGRTTRTAFRVSVARDARLRTERVSEHIRADLDGPVGDTPGRARGTPARPVTVKRRQPRRGRIDAPVRRSSLARVRWCTPNSLATSASDAPCSYRAAARATDWSVILRTTRRGAMPARSRWWMTVVRWTAERPESVDRDTLLMQLDQLSDLASGQPSAGRRTVMAEDRQMIDRGDVMLPA